MRPVSSYPEQRSAQRSPRSVQQVHTPELVERNAAPVIRRSRRFQTPLAVSAVLIAKHWELPLLVPSQPVRTKHVVAIMVNSRDWPPALADKILDETLALS